MLTLVHCDAKFRTTLRIKCLRLKLLYELLKKRYLDHDVAPRIELIIALCSITINIKQFTFIRKIETGENEVYKTFLGRSLLDFLNQF